MPTSIIPQGQVDYNAEDESDIAKYTPGWTVDEDGRPVQIDNLDVDDMMEDMSL